MLVGSIESSNQLPSRVWNGSIGGDKLSHGAIDCNKKGQIIFDAADNLNHRIRCFEGSKMNDKIKIDFNEVKQFVRLFNSYVIIVTSSQKS